MCMAANCMYKEVLWSTSMTSAIMHAVRRSQTDSGIEGWEWELGRSMFGAQST